MLAFLLSLAALIGGYFIYGAVVAEGIVALIWAAATLTFTEGYTGLGLDYSFGIWTGVAVSAFLTFLFARSLQRREAVSIKDLEA